VIKQLLLNVHMAILKGMQECSHILYTLIEIFIAAHRLDEIHVTDNGEVRKE
jgi:hypothetical protein